MDLQELMDMLELDDPGDFEYFENFADLVECDERIPEETLEELFSQTDDETVAEIVKSYFEEILELVPQENIEMYTLLMNICRTLTGYTTGDFEDGAMRFAEELAKFKDWYVFESSVRCISRTTDEEKELPVRDALTMLRLERLQGDEYIYEFDGALDYDLDEYVINLEELMYDDEDSDLGPEDGFSSGYTNGF